MLGGEDELATEWKGFNDTLSLLWHLCDEIFWCLQIHISYAMQSEIAAVIRSIGWTIIDLLWAFIWVVSNPLAKKKAFTLITCLCKSWGIMDVMQRTLIWKSGYLNSRPSCVSLVSTIVRSKTIPSPESDSLSLKQARWTDYLSVLSHVCSTINIPPKFFSVRWIPFNSQNQICKK